MLDRHVVAGDHDAFHEEPHEALAAGEIQLVEPRAEGGCERGEVVPEAIEAGTIHRDRRQFLGAGARRGARDAP